MSFLNVNLLQLEKAEQIHVIVPTVVEYVFGVCLNFVVEDYVG